MLLQLVLNKRQQNEGRKPTKQLQPLPILRRKSSPLTNHPDHIHPVSKGGLSEDDKFGSDMRPL